MKRSSCFRGLPSKPRILMTRIDRIGDVILTTPVFQILKETYPDSFLGVVVSSTVREAVQDNPYLDEVFVYDKKGKEKSPWGTWAFARKMARQKFDVCINFHATNRMFWLGLLAGIPCRIGHRRKAWRLLTHSIEERKREGEKHETEYNLELLDVLGVPRPEKIPPIHFPLREKDRLSLLNKIPELKNKSYIVLSPSASCISKRWPPERFRKVGEMFHQKKGVSLCVTGTQAEKAACQEVVKGISAEAYDLSGKLTLGELGWLFKGSELLISNDSGPVHIAAALDVPVVSLFGRSDPGLSPTRWKPLGEKSVYIHKTLESGEETIDYTVPCKRLLEIAPEEVVEIAEKLL